MIHNKTYKTGTILILLGAAAFVAAALLTGSYLWEQHRAEQTSSQLLARVKQWSDLPEEKMNSTVLVENPEGESMIWDNYDIDGVLSIHSLGLELPILSQYSEDLLKISPCIYQGLGGSDPDRLVIAGHNYRAHFGRLGKLVPSDQITYRSLDKVETQFQVTELVKIGEDDIDLLENGDWDLTLLTCNLDMSRRLLVRCNIISSSSSSQEDTPETF